MKDIRLDFEPDVLIAKAQTQHGREILKSLLGASERAVPWGQAKPFLDALSFATEHYNVSIESEGAR